MPLRSSSTAVALLMSLGLLAGCNTGDRISQIGATPQFSQIEDPNARNGFQPVRMPMPAPQVSERQPNSLWRSGSRAFFKDQRASRVGDIMTVTIQINDEARINNQTTRTRSSTETLGLPGLFGFQRNIARILPTPDTDTLENLGQTNSDSESTGRGQIQRTDSVRLRVAAIITQVLPNGNFAIEGRQEVRVNFELRDLQIRGVIRPEDIDNQNTIPYDKIAEARIAYGGRGQITDVQQPRWGQQVYDIIAPF